MATCTISGTIKDPSGVALSNVPVSFNIQNPLVSYDPVEGSTSTASDGTWGLTVAQGLSGVITIKVINGSSGRKTTYRFNVAVPAATTATFGSILVDN